MKFKDNNKPIITEIIDANKPVEETKIWVHRNIDMILANVQQEKILTQQRMTAILGYEPPSSSRKTLNNPNDKLLRKKKICGLL